MKQYLKTVATQATSILLAAGGAALLAFAASVASQTGVCEPTAISVPEAGALGGALKGVHSVLAAMHLKIRL